MISKKIFAADGSNIRFLSDFIIRSEQFTRVYNYVFDENGVEGDVDPSSGLFIRVSDVPNSEDLITIDKWDLVDNSISFYLPPYGGSRVYIEVATTSEEFGDTLVQPSVERAEEAARASEASAVAALASETAAGISAGVASAAQIAAQASETAAALSETNAGDSEDNAALSETNAAVSETNAGNSETKAYEWAENPEDVPVEVGEYSAKHWAIKAINAGGITTPTFPLNEGWAWTARATGNVWEKLLGLPSETGNAHKTVTTDGVEGDSYWSPFVTSPNVISEDFTIAVGGSASIVSPTINDGVTVTIPDGSTLVIL